MSTPVDPPLAGVRILDLAEGDFQMVGRYLADLGADVLRVEPPGGSPDRAAGVLSDGVSLTFEIANAGKRFTTADPLDELLAGADIVLLDRRSAFVTGGRLDPSELTDSHPGTVVTLLSDFGAQGSRKDWVSTPGVQFALSTILSRSGLPDRGEPLLPPSFLVAGAVAPQAVWLTLAAHLRARRSGVGELVDFATLEALLHIFDPPMGMQGSGRTGIDPFDVPYGRPAARTPARSTRSSPPPTAWCVYACSPRASGSRCAGGSATRRSCVPRNCAVRRGGWRRRRWSSPTTVRCSPG